MTALAVPAATVRPARRGAECWYPVGYDGDCCSAPLTYENHAWVCPRGHELRQYEDLPLRTRRQIHLAQAHIEARWEYVDHRGGPRP